MNSQNEAVLTPEEQILITRLKSFRVPEMANTLAAQLKDPNADLNTLMERISAMVDSEWQSRANKRFNRLMKEAHLRYPTAGGKTYLINAFCVTAMRQSNSVKYIKANTLMSEMEQARIKSTNLDYLNKLTKLDLLVIDDFGLMDLDLDKCRDLFEVLDTRDGRKSTVVISQFPVSSWFDMSSDNTYADACLTRITDKHHTYRLEMNGANMRNTD